MTRSVAGLTRRLTARERQVYALLQRGRLYEEIAHILEINVATARVLGMRALRKRGTSVRALRARA